MELQPVDVLCDKMRVILTPADVVITSAKQATL
jgi:hypothetical protein